MSTKKKKYVDICDNGTYNDTNGTQRKGGKQMEDKGKMQINEIREDAAEFAEIGKSTKNKKKRMRKYF